MFHKQINCNQHQQTNQTPHLGVLVAEHGGVVGHDLHPLLVDAGLLAHRLDQRASGQPVVVGSGGEMEKMRKIQIRCTSQ